MSDSPLVHYCKPALLSPSIIYRELNSPNGRLSDVLWSNGRRNTLADHISDPLQRGCRQRMRKNILSYFLASFQPIILILDLVPFVIFWNIHLVSMFTHVIVNDSIVLHALIKYTCLCYRRDTLYLRQENLETQPMFPLPVFHLCICKVTPDHFRVGHVYSL